MTTTPTPTPLHPVATTQAGELPKLPISKGNILVFNFDRSTQPNEAPGYTADQMTAYALAAIEMQASHSAAADAVPVAWRWKYFAEQDWIYGEKLPKGDHWKPYKSLFVSEPLVSPTTAPAATTPAGIDTDAFFTLLNDWFTTPGHGIDKFDKLVEYINAHTAAQVAANKPVEVEAARNEGYIQGYTAATVEHNQRQACIPEPVESDDGYCAPDNTGECSCRKFAADPTGCSRKEPAAVLPKWIDAMKGADPTMDGVTEWIEAHIEPAAASGEAPASPPDSLSKDYPKDERAAFDKWHMRYGQGFRQWSVYNSAELVAAWAAWYARSTLTTPQHQVQAGGGATALQAIKHNLQIMLASAKPAGGESITGYYIQTGALHRILGVMASAGYAVSIPLHEPLPPQEVAETLANFQGTMRTETIPAIVETMRERAEVHAILSPGSAAKPVDLAGLVNALNEAVQNIQRYDQGAYQDNRYEWHGNLTASAKGEVVKFEDVEEAIADVQALLASQPVPAKREGDSPPLLLNTALSKADALALAQWTDDYAKWCRSSPPAPATVLPAKEVAGLTDEWFIDIADEVRPHDYGARDGLIMYGRAIITALKEKTA